MANLFKKAVRSTARLRLAIQGPSGYGKTYTALKMMSRLAERWEQDNPNEKFRIAVIDTEGFSASVYAGEPGMREFDVLPMPYDGAEYPGHHPVNYTNAIKMAEEAGYHGIIIDSLTHEWNGEGGCLELVDKITQASKTKNSYAAWGKVTPHHRRLIEYFIRTPMHVIVTMRSSEEYVLDDKNRPQKIGMAPEQRRGMSFEFSIVLDMVQRAIAQVEKTRCSLLKSDIPYEEPGPDLMDTIYDWLMSGEDDAAFEAETARQLAEVTDEEPQATVEAESEAPAAPANGNGKAKSYGDVLTALMKTSKFKKRSEVDAAIQEKFGELSIEQIGERAEEILAELA